MLTAEQVARVDSPFATLISLQFDVQEKFMAGARGEAQQAELEKLRKSTDEISEKLLATISAPKLERLDQLVRQSDGLFVFRNPDVHKRFELDRRQVETIDAILYEFEDFVTTAPREGEVRAKWLEDRQRKKEHLLKDVYCCSPPSNSKPGKISSAVVLGKRPAHRNVFDTADRCPPRRLKPGFPPQPLLQ